MKFTILLSVLPTVLFSIMAFARSSSSLNVDCSNTSQIMFKGNLIVKEKKVEDGAGAMAYPVKGDMLTTVKGKYSEALFFNLGETVSVAGFLYGELPDHFSLYLENTASHSSTWKPQEMHFLNATLEAPNSNLWSAIGVNLGIQEYPTHPAIFSMKLKCQYKVVE